MRVVIRILFYSRTSTSCFDCDQVLEHSQTVSKLRARTVRSNLVIRPVEGTG